MQVIEYPERDETLYVEHFSAICPHCGYHQFGQATKITSRERDLAEPVAVRQYIERMLSKQRDEFLDTALCDMCKKPLHAKNQ